MSSTGIITLAIIIANVLVSYQGLNNHSFFARYSFEVERVLVHKEYKRIITGGFLHVNWMHLIFNMLSLYFFSGSVELILGPIYYLLIYFASLIGGNLFSLFLHRHEGSYSSVGASGAVTGIMFAAIAIFPGMSIGFFLIPIAIPGWIYGLVYVLYSIYGIRSRRDNIGHDAHLGGGLIGLLIAILLVPSSLVTNYFPILAIAVPSLIFIFIIVRRPQFLLIQNQFYKTQYKYSIDQRYNLSKLEKQKEVDRILEKIHRKGMASLSKKEKETLEEYSKKT
ncbi:MAG TPA: rhomboid family intramembrane serine protease [Chitinophagaceae bacterium]|nr:rhomboid family intramembrane serine protease [Chitinophagaceae bacterium]